MIRLKILIFFAALAIAPVFAWAGDNPLAGTWTLVAADKILPDGQRVADYGALPVGLMMVDAAGHYSVQIYDTSRPYFGAGDKLKGTPEEYRAAILGASTHFGMMTVDPAAHTLTIDMIASAYPNQQGTHQVRIYELDGDVLTYRIPPRPDGSVAVSVWRRAPTAP